MRAQTAHFVRIRQRWSCPLQAWLGHRVAARLGQREYIHGQKPSPSSRVGPRVNRSRDPCARLRRGRPGQRAQPGGTTHSYGRWRPGRPKSIPPRIDASYVDGRTTPPRHPDSRCSRCRGTGRSGRSASGDTSRPGPVIGTASGSSTCSARSCRCSPYCSSWSSRRNASCPATAPRGGAARSRDAPAPFSTLFFDHLLSAAFGFAAFVVLLLARERDASAWWLVAAGLLAGLAVVVEFPLGIVAAVLGLYALTWVRPIGHVWATPQAS